MDYLDSIRSGIEALYKTNPNVHINVKLARPKVILEDVSVVIVGVYRNIFQVEGKDGGRPTRYTFQYGDVLIGHVVIRELDYDMPARIVKK